MPTNKEEELLIQVMDIIKSPSASKISTADIAVGMMSSTVLYEKAYAIEQLILAREEAAEKRGASKAATAINGELGLDLTSNGSYYLERFDRLYSQSQPTMKDSQ